MEFAGYGSGTAMPDTPESLVMQGLDDFNHGEYNDALKVFNEVKDRFPFSKESLLAELKAADSHYYMQQYDEARALYEEFEENHPTNEAIPYVLFQIGRCYYEEIDTIDRDPAGAVKAIEVFSRLLQTYPQSPYTDEARARVAAARNFLANHEYYVADFYVRTESYEQAERRLKYLLATYPDSEVTGKARDLLAALESGNPPERTWRSWLPSFSLPNWETFSRSFKYGTAGGTSAE